MANETMAVPAELLDMLAQSKLAGLDSGTQVRVALAIHLFLTQEISVSRAAELAGYPLVEFYDLLAKLNLPVVFYGPEELAQDIATIEATESERRGGRGRLIRPS